MVGKLALHRQMETAQPTHLSNFNAICITALMSIALLLSVKCNYLFFKELTMAYSIICFVLFKNTLNQPLDSKTKPSTTDTQLN